MLVRLTFDLDKKIIFDQSKIILNQKTIYRRGRFFYRTVQNIFFSTLSTSEKNYHIIK